MAQRNRAILLIQTQVLIIGGGVTGTALARDLALRGVDCILVEKDDINAGASGRNHGLLHSGASYVAGDREAAMECQSEGSILKRIAPQAIQDTSGYFVAVQGDDERYVADFPLHCERAGIQTSAVDVATARALEAVVSARGVRRRHQTSVRALTFDASTATLDLDGVPGGERVSARAVVLATGRFSGRGLTADRAGVRESILGLPVHQPASREAWHQRDFLNPAGHAINRAGLITDDAWRPLDASGKPAWPRLFAIPFHIPISEQDTHASHRDLCPTRTAKLHRDHI